MRDAVRPSDRAAISAFPAPRRRCPRASVRIHSSHARHIDPLPLVRRRRRGALLRQLRRAARRRDLQDVRLLTHAGRPILPSLRRSSRRGNGARNTRSRNDGDPMDRRIDRARGTRRTGRGAALQSTASLQRGTSDATGRNAGHSADGPRP